VVRAWQGRRISVGHDPKGPRALLRPPVRGLVERGRRPRHVHARDGRPARDTTVAVAFAAVRLRGPKGVRGLYRKTTRAVGLVRVRAIDPPADGAEPVDWVPSAGLAVAAAAGAWEEVDWDGARRVIEGYHKAQKTGCAIGAPPFTKAERLQPMVALVSVVAVAPLNLRERSRCAETAARPARPVLPQGHMAVLRGRRYGERRPLTVQEFCRAPARRGDHRNRKKDKPAGGRVRWRGWSKLQLMVGEARVAAAPPGPAKAPAAIDGQQGNQNRSP